MSNRIERIRQQLRASAVIVEIEEGLEYALGSLPNGAIPSLLEVLDELKARTAHIYNEDGSSKEGTTQKDVINAYIPIIDHLIPLIALSAAKLDPEITEEEIAEVVNLGNIAQFQTALLQASHFLPKLTGEVTKPPKAPKKG